jgi:release factor glutamine methyltransferase
MLARLISRDPRLPGSRVLDLCTGSGALAIAAARAGAQSVTAVDVSRRSVATARLNAALNGARIRALRGDLLQPVEGGRFDVIVSNPPYVPSVEDALPRRGERRAWDAGRDGRTLLDRIAREAPAHLEPGGTLWLVHSSVCDTGRTLDSLAAAGLEASVAETARGPLGPLLAARAPMLAERGLIDPDTGEEELVAIRAVAA